jgi:hypothetical protein
MKFAAARRDKVHKGILRLQLLLSIAATSLMLTITLLTSNVQSSQNPKPERVKFISRSDGDIIPPEADGDLGIEKLPPEEIRFRIFV